MRFFQKQMYLRILTILFMFVFVVPAFAVESADGTGAQNTTNPHNFIATYFHTTLRCPTCHRIETLSAEAIKGTFANELKNGTLVWRTINVDESENRHYNTDYQLYTKSLIISEIKDGKEIRWKNLEKIWHFVRDEDAFRKYVTTEIKAWIAP